ncbi:unnamed protein product [Prunus brigantina]
MFHFPMKILPLSCLLELAKVDMEEFVIVFSYRFCGRCYFVASIAVVDVAFPVVAAYLTTITIAYLAIVATAATPPSITMLSVDAFISSRTSGSTSLTVSSTFIVIVHTQSSTNLLLVFKLNGSNYASWVR